MFWTSERVNWREEATDVGARKRSTAVIHAAEGGTGTRAGTDAVNGTARHSCARAPARARTSVHAQAQALAGARALAWACTSVHAQAHALAGARAPARACASVHAQAHALAGAWKSPGTSWNPVASSSATMCGSQPINATGMGADAVGATGAGTGAGTRAASSCKASSSLS